MDQRIFFRELTEVVPNANFDRNWRYLQNESTWPAKTAQGKNGSEENAPAEGGECVLIDAGVDIRGRFIIDPDFVIRTTGEVTLSGWQPGQVSLKPGPALVGKVWQVWKP
jgi:hypothetical protein